MMSSSDFTLPRVHIRSIDTNGVLLGFENPLWIGEDWITYLMPLYGTLIEGRIVSVDLAAKTCRFIPKDKLATSVLSSNTDCEYLDGYWGDRAELVFSQTGDWIRTEFFPRDCVTCYPDGSTKLNPGGWEHEHCEICWETISQHTDHQHFGYRNPNDDWVCEQCFRSYVEPKKLGFITAPDQDPGDEEIGDKIAGNKSGISYQKLPPTSGPSPS